MKNKILITTMIVLMFVLVGEIIYFFYSVKKTSYNNPVLSPSPSPSSTLVDYSKQKALSILKDIPLITQKYLFGYASKSKNPLVTANFLTVQVEGQISVISTTGGKFDPNLPDTYKIKIDLVDEKNQSLTVYYSDLDLPYIKIVDKKSDNKEVPLSFENLKKGDKLNIQEIFNLKTGKTKEITVSRLSTG